MLECFHKHLDIEIAYKFLLFYEKEKKNIQGRNLSFLGSLLIETLKHLIHSKCELHPIKGHASSRVVATADYLEVSVLA